MRAFVVCLVTIAALFTSQVARAAKSDDVFVWFTTHVCNTKLEPGTAGSSPETAIDVAEFDEVYEAAAEAKNPPEGQQAASSRFECKWVRLTGFFTWSNYYHYRGDLYESAWRSYYSTPTSLPARYIVERFADRATRRAKLAQRKVTLVGRFYDLCEAAHRAEASSDKRWVMLFGPCHYGENRGMMLTDVRVAQVHDEAPRYILGESNRAFFDELPLVEGDERAALIDSVRAWAASAKRGPKFLADELLKSDPYWAKQTDVERKDMREHMTDPDGYLAFLSSEPRFKTLDPARAEVAVFWDGPGEAETRLEAVGCICLRDSCADRWPLFRRDTPEFLGDAACTSLQREGASGVWRWR